MPKLERSTVAVALLIAGVLTIAGPSDAAEATPTQKPSQAVATGLVSDSTASSLEPTEADGQAAVSYCADAIAKGINDAKIDGSAEALEALGLPREANTIRFTKTAADTYELAYSQDGNIIHQTFGAGALVMGLIGNAGDLTKRGDLKTIGLIGPTLTRCTEAAFVLTGQAGADVGRDLRKRYDEQFTGH
jgi:hypothetical protein